VSLLVRGLLLDQNGPLRTTSATKLEPLSRGQRLFRVVVISPVLIPRRHVMGDERATHSDPTRLHWVVHDHGYCTNRVERCGQRVTEREFFQEHAVADAAATMPLIP
jgi:hypothetical protein